MAKITTDERKSQSGIRLDLHLNSTVFENYCEISRKFGLKRDLFENRTIVKDQLANERKQSKLKLECSLLNNFWTSLASMQQEKFAQNLKEERFDQSKAEFSNVREWPNDNGLQNSLRSFQINNDACQQISSVNSSEINIKKEKDSNFERCKKSVISKDEQQLERTIKSRLTDYDTDAIIAGHQARLSTNISPSVQFESFQKARKPYETIILKMKKS